MCVVLYGAVCVVSYQPLALEGREAWLARQLCVCVCVCDYYLASCPVFPNTIFFCSVKQGDWSRG